MIGTLVRVRFRALWAGMAAQGKKKGKGGKGMSILLAVLFLYVAVVMCGAMGAMFWQLAGPYHAMGLDWLYFAMAGLMGLGLAIMGSVFTTQNQLYDAKDNDLLMAMPIKSSTILVSRMVPLLVMNLLFSGIIILPAVVVYAIAVEFSLLNVVLQLLCLPGIVALAQSVACLLGWGLHLLLSRLNKSAASVLYMVVFLGVYFAVYSQAGTILNAIAASGEAIAGALKSWVWPLYAMGRGSTGSIGLLLVFLLICGAVFALACRVLSATFLGAATAKRGSRRKQLDWNAVRANSSTQALLGRELRHFLGSPVYLTNMGVGLLMTLALTAAGLIFRSDLLAVLELPELAFLRQAVPLLVVAILGYLSFMTAISAPSVSLEGKSLWIVRSMPLSSGKILQSKLLFHCVLSAPLSMVCALVLAIAYGCGLAGSLLAALAAGLFNGFVGVVGMVAGLKWARLDWINEAYPCKQSVAVLVAMLGGMGLILGLGLLYYFLADLLAPVAYLAVCCALLASLNYGLYRLMMGWGVRRWEAL